MLNIQAYGLYKGLTPEKLVTEKAKFANSAVIKADVEYFKSKIAAMETPDDFLKNYRVFKFALTAYNMETQLDYPFRIKTIMKDDPSNSAALVNRMSDPSYREINKAFDFFNSGVAKLKDAAFIDSLVKKYSEAKYESSLGDISPNVSAALYFDRKIGGVTNAYQIIGDPVLFDVVKTALNIPNAAVQGKVERLKAWIEKDLDMTRLSDKAYIRKITERFLVLKDVETRKSEGNGLLDMFA